MSTKHTEGKLTVTGQDAFGDWIIQFGPEASHVVAATTCNQSGGQDEANAHRLALAWNCHDELVEALDRLYEATSLTCRQEQGDELHDAHLQARAVLARVKGGE